MVRVCAFPNCGNKMRRHTCLSFHRLPLGDINTLKLWLAVLQMDVNTPLHVLRLADLRVCSDHFHRVDYCQSNRRRNPTPKHLFLKKTAVPRVERPTADLVEGTDCGDVSPKESECAAVPLSTPYRASRERSGSSRSSLSSSLILLLSSPQQSTVAPCTKQSLSGTYLARPPTWKQSLVSSRKGNALTPVSACSEVEKSSWPKALKSLQTPHGLNIFRSSEVIVKTQCSPSHRDWRSHPSSAEPAQTFHNGADHAVKNEDDDDVDEVVVQIVSSDNECSEQVFIEKDRSYLSSDDEEGSLQEEEVKKKRKFKSKDSSDEWEPCLDEEATDFDSDEDLVTALKEDGQSKLVVWCTQCGTEASLSCSVLRHKKVFCCAQCSPGDGIQTYNFETLPVRFDDVASFQKHAEQEHRAKPFSILCQDCGKFVRADPESRGLKEHKCEHKSKFIICPDCGKRFLTEGGLKTHYTQLHSDYDHPCKYCLKVFKTRSAKLDHEQTHPKENQPYSCPDCPEKFSNIHKRNKHVKSHRGPHKYVCDVCEKGFKDINRLRRHKLIHSGEKPFKCQVCERSFNQIENLTSHMRVHTGEKPFICEQCGESFSHNVSLKNHKQRHHDSSLSQEK